MKRKLEGHGEPEELKRKRIPAGLTENVLEELEDDMKQLEAIIYKVSRLSGSLGDLEDRTVEAENEKMQTLLDSPYIHLARKLAGEYRNGSGIVGEIVSMSKDRVHDQMQAGMDSLLGDRAVSKNAPAAEKPAQKSKWPPPLPVIGDRVLREKVFTHKSDVVDNPRLTKEEILEHHNERLEFLGDAIINFIASLSVFDRFPTAPEGFLSSTRARIVKNENLWNYSEEYKLKNRLRLKLPNGTTLADHSKIISDLFEAYIGGLFLDKSQGPAVVQAWIKALIEPDLVAIEKEIKKPVIRDAKQELYGRIGSSRWPIEYVTIVQGSSTEPYTVQARIRGTVLGTGTDKNAKAAGLRAAMEALNNKQLMYKYERLRREGWHEKHPRNQATSQASKAKTSVATATIDNAKNVLYGLLGSETEKPIYASTSISDSHDPSAVRFKTVVYFQGKLLAEGSGPTKKASEGNAALNALAKHNKQN